MMCHYRILGVAKDASKLAIRKAYLQKAKQHHPDVSNVKSSAAQFLKIQEAYAILSHDDKRKEYDMKIGILKKSPKYSTNDEIDDELEELRRQEDSWRSEFAHYKTFNDGPRRNTPHYNDFEANESYFQNIRNASNNKNFRRLAVFYFSRILPLWIFPSLLFFIIYKQIGAARHLQEKRRHIQYDQYGRAYSVDMYGRTERIPEFDQLHAGQ